MTETTIAAWFNKVVAAAAVFLIGQIVVHVVKKWVDKIMDDGKKWVGSERRKSNTLVIDQDTVTRVIQSFEDHVRIMQRIADTLTHQKQALEENKKVLEIHTELVQEPLRLIKEIHKKISAA